MLDEIQKVRGWSETVKRLWDEKKSKRGLVRSLLRAASALVVQRSLSEKSCRAILSASLESLALAEEPRSFRMGFARWIHFGGYPGGASPMIREDPA